MSIQNLKISTHLKKNRENSQGATNPVISSKSLFLLLFQQIYASRIDVYKLLLKIFVFFKIINVLYVLLRWKLFTFTAL